MSTLYLGLGTNLGDRRENLSQALRWIEKEVGPVLMKSAAYETEPWGFVSSHGFLNMALAVDTSLTPRQVLCATERIERAVGRSEKSGHGGYADRVIDIDLLLQEDLVLHHPELEIPHPLMAQRTFVLLPMVEIAPLVKHPVLGRTMCDLLNDLMAGCEENIAPLGVRHTEKCYFCTENKGGRICAACNHGKKC